MRCSSTAAGSRKPESSATELAALLHQQLISEMTLLDRLDNDGWHTFLSLLAKSPEDTRAIGGVAKAWEETGNKSIKLTEIDYAEVLRERAGTGESATWDRILTALKDEIDEASAAASERRHDAEHDGARRRSRAPRASSRSACRTSARPAATIRSSSASRCSS